MSRSSPQTIRLNPGANVIVTRPPLEKGASVIGEGVTASEAIPRGHKMAVRDLAAGEAVVKYGQAIGVATRAIAAGEHAHTHNL